ncbi:hypothetical protein J5N97_025150 [Dioscorea zingiberensis]|uniref:Mediator of RNA polymerase II transcription subunit 13 n=1 Tax=Dioscorea zingiberensis TaxID=325984 RepID=A0A9D5C8J5_9LILI|nr:hypothetical protein J5N97_025150 [Dioscorea zingiberensis]
MWTNVFRIGEQLRTVSWFQFLPSESDVNNLPEISLKVEQKDAATCLVLSGHLQLQNEGFLSTWTNSFVGPWDPSQGVHNPDEKIKLWLFIPGRHSSVIEKAQAAVSKIIETALHYMRFGDVFTRRALPTIEFVFAATEEAIYVHAVISAKYVRGLCSDDMEKLLKYRSSNSVQEGIPVIVAPNGMRGRLIGCRPSDLVKQVYASKVKVSNGLSVGIPFHVAQSSVCQLRGQSFYAEVTLGCPSTSKDCSLKSVRYQTEVLVQHNEEQHQVSSESVHQKQGSADKLPLLERTFLYPAETVLLPIMATKFSGTPLLSCGHYGTFRFISSGILVSKRVRTGMTETFGQAGTVPPGTAESQAIMFPSADSGDVSGSPAPSSSKFDYLIKAEAMMIFAPEYAAVKIPTSEPSTSVVRNTYLPRSKRVDSLSSGTYFYSATPLSPCKDSAIEKNEISLKAKPNNLGHDGSLAVSSRELYTYIDHGMRKVEKRPRNHDVPPLKRDVTSPVSVLNSATPVLTIQKKSGSTFEAGQLLLSLKTTLATEIDCIMFQAAMCKIRHTLLSLSNRAPLWYEAKRKDPVPVRIAGDVDVIMTDGPVTAPVGVWRSVGTTKGPKALNTFNSESSPSLPHSMSNADNFVLLGQRQPLQELLDAMALLVQQSTSFVDVSLGAR